MNYDAVPYSAETQAKLEAVLKDPANPLYASVSKLWNEYVAVLTRASFIKMTPYGAKVQSWQQDVRRIQIQDLLNGTQTPLPPKPVEERPVQPPPGAFVKIFEPALQAQLEAVLSNPAHPLYSQIIQPYLSYARLITTPQGVSTAQQGAEQVQKLASMRALIGTILSGALPPSVPVQQASPFVLMFDPATQAKLEQVLSSRAHPLYASVEPLYDQFTRIQVPPPPPFQPGVDYEQSPEAKARGKIATQIRALLNGTVSPQDAQKKAAANLAPAESGFPAWGWVALGVLGAVAVTRYWKWK